VCLSRCAVRFWVGTVRVIIVIVNSEMAFNVKLGSSGILCVFLFKISGLSN